MASSGVSAVAAGSGESEIVGPTAAAYADVWVDEAA